MRKEKYYKFLKSTDDLKAKPGEDSDEKKEKQKF